MLFQHAPHGIRDALVATFEIYLVDFPPALNLNTHAHMSWYIGHTGLCSYRHPHSRFPRFPDFSGNTTHFQNIQFSLHSMATPLVRTLLWGTIDPVYSKQMATLLRLQLPSFLYGFGVNSAWTKPMDQTYPPLISKATSHWNKTSPPNTFIFYGFDGICIF